ncbi:MAG: LCP family protein, partial [Lachnospiraceae bacterium]
NIRTLVKLIDAIGGVDIDLTEAEANHLDNPEGTYTEGYAKGVGMEDEEQFDLTAGVNHLNGVTAMVYARTRYIDDDWHRVQRQRKVIMAAAEKLSKLSASEMISTLDAVIPLVQTDLSETEVAELLTLAPVFMGAEIQQITIPVDGTYGSMKGMDGRSMYAVDFNANAKILKEMLYGITDEEAEEQVNEEGGTAATDYTNTSRTSGYVSDESVTAEDAQNAQAAKAAADTAAANSATSSSGSTSTGSSTGTTSSSYLQQQTANEEVEQAMNVPQNTTTDTDTQDTTGTTDTTGTATDGTQDAASGTTTDYAAQQAQYQQQADSLNQAATQNQAAATQAALQAQDETLTEEQRAAAQEQANQLAVLAQQQAVAAQQAQEQANAAAAQAAAGTGDGTAAGN